MQLSTIRGVPFPTPNDSAPHLVINLDPTRPTGTLANIKEEQNNMNILLTIELDVQKFAKNTGSDLEKFATSFEKLFGKAPAALQAVQNFVGEVAPVITDAVSLADPVAEPVVAAALATAETGLASVDAAATAATSGNSLLTNLQNFAATVPATLTGLDVKNPALTAKVTQIVNLITGEAKVLVPAVQSWVAQIKTATPAA